MRLLAKIGQWALVIVAIAAFSLYRDQMGITLGTVLLVGVLAVYVHLSSEKLRERLGLAELPRYAGELDTKGREPISPRHEISTGIEPEGWGITEGTHAFHADFERFGDVLNKWLGETPWRLQEVADPEVSTLGDDGPVYGRRYRLFFGSRETGRVTISGSLRYPTRSDIDTMIEIEGARQYHAEDLTELLDGLAAHVAASDAGETSAARQEIRNAMTEAMWQLGPDVLINNTDLDFRLRGSPAWFLQKAEANRANAEGQKKGSLEIEGDDN